MEIKTKTPHQLTPGQKIYRAIKAGIDFVIALIALIVLIPFFIIVAIAIKIDSKGPVFFVQKRIGMGGKSFNFIKFRSMSVDANHNIGGYECEEITSYITKVGAVIRKLSIDELPQLFNVLTFKMSLIGYRPSLLNQQDLNEARESYNMYQIRPGLSGWAQVNGRDLLAAQPTVKAQFDNYYLHHFSFWLDVKIFFMTIVQLLRANDVVEGVIPQEDVPSAAEVTAAEEKEKEAVMP